MTHNARIELLPIPASLDDEGGMDFIEMVEVRNTIEALAVGTVDLSPTPEELLPHWQNSEFDPQDLYVARVGGRIVGRAVVGYPVEAGSRVATLSIEVLPEYRSHGIGRALLAAAESAAAAAGRTTLQGWAYHGSDPGSAPLTPTTGFGSVDSSRAEVRFALSAGYSLEQIERMSVLVLPTDAALLESIRRDALDHAADYRVLAWEGRVPAEWMGEFAHMHQRMSTDAPAGGLDIDEEEWSEQRMLALLDAVEKGGSRILTAAALHVPSGHLAGYTDLHVPVDQSRAAVQDDTLVLREHRGHRLGMLLKIENVLQLQRLSPGTPRITTFNAEENRPMLDVNEGIGFVPFGYEGAWQKTVSG